MKKLTGWCFLGLGLVFAGFLLAGCETTDTPRYGWDPTASDTPPVAGGTNRTGVLQEGDSLTVSFADLGQNSVSPVEAQIAADGAITLIYDQKFEAVGKTIGELQAEIRKRYVPDYFKNMTPTIKVQDRFFSVGGEVKGGNRFLWTGKISVLQAINAAGGFTEFANKKNVSLTRANGEQFKENCKAALSNPELDLPVYPGDLVTVHKRIW